MFVVHRVFVVCAAGGLLVCWCCVSAWFVACVFVRTALFACVCVRLRSSLRVGCCILLDCLCVGVCLLLVVCYAFFARCVLAGVVCCSLFVARRMLCVRCVMFVFVGCLFVYVISCCRLLVGVCWLSFVCLLLLVWVCC